MPDEIQKNLKHNFIVNMVDAIFFGMGIGISSFNTVIPLFVATMTDSATLIGLIPAIHNTGWQFPQLFTAHRITRMPRFKPFVILMTIQERIPFLGLAAVALLSPKIGPAASLVLTYILLIWQGMGAGMTANAWQNMVSRIIPSHVLATFFGLQSGASNLMSSGGAVIAGFLLANMQSPGSFALCFVITFGLMAASYASLSLTHEHEKPDLTVDNTHADFWRNVVTIMKKDEPFRWFIISRNAFQFGMMAQAFFIIYAIKILKMDLEAAGILTGLLFFTQVVANPILGWIADKWNSSNVIKGGAASIGLASLLAWWAPDPAWFYLVIILSGTASTAFWTIGIAKSLEFGTDEEKPTYVGLSNTLIAPSTILAPLLGGWLADMNGYSTTFLTAAVFATLGVVLMQVFVKDSGKKALQA